MSIQEDLTEVPFEEGPLEAQDAAINKDRPDTGQEIPRHIELMVGLEHFFSGLPPQKIEFMRSLLQEFPSISDAISQELQMSTDQMDDFFGAMLGEERKTPTARSQQEQMAPPIEQQPVNEMEQPVNEVDRMLQAGRGQEQPLI